MARDMNNLIKRVKGYPTKDIWGRPSEAFNIPKYNQEVILEFDSRLVSKGRKFGTRSHYMFVLANLCHRIHKPLKNITEKDMIGFVNSWIQNNENFNISTRNTYKRALKTFFKWLQGDNKHIPESVEFIEYERQDKSISSEDLINREDIKAMIKACNTPQKRALIITLFESLFRRGEIIKCRVRDLKFHPEGYAILSIPAKSDVKTGAYSATLIESIPYLKTHLNHHPFADEPEAPLFYSERYDRKGAWITSDGMYCIIRNIARAANIKKRIFVHLFRHSRSTELARQGYTAEEINLASGRKQGSKVAQVYISLNGGDVRKKILQRAGILPEEQTNGILELPKITCWNCETENPAINHVCLNDKCNMPLRVKPEQKEKLSRVSNAMMLVDVMSKLEKKPKVYQEYLNSLKRIESMLTK